MPAGNLGGLKEVLLVEDNAGEALLIQEAFQDSGAQCRTTVASDGAMALAMLRREDPYAATPVPDLILLDLNLPKINGHEVLKELKKDDRLRHIPVLVLTSSRAEKDILTSYNLHCNAYLNKPSDIGQHTQLVRLIVDFWLKTVLRPGKS